MKPSTWLQGFVSAAIGGLGDGILVGLGGSGAVSATSHTVVSLRAIAAVVAVNTVLDVGRYLKSNPNPFAPPAPTPPQLVVPGPSGPSGP